jgi:hypothetical protein
MNSFCKSVRFKLFCSRPYNKTNFNPGRWAPENLEMAARLCIQMAHWAFDLMSPRSYRRHRAARQILASQTLCQSRICTWTACGGFRGLGRAESFRCRKTLSCLFRGTSRIGLPIRAGASYNCCYMGRNTAPRGSASLHRRGEARLQTGGREKVRNGVHCEKNGDQGMVCG